MGKRGKLNELSIEERQALVLSCLKMVHHLAMRKFHIFPQDAFYSELIDYGNAMLVRAAQIFDPFRGVKFFSYAYRYCWGMMLRYVKKKWRDNSRACSFDSPQHEGARPQIELVQDEQSPDPAAITQSLSRDELEQLLLRYFSPRDSAIFLWHMCDRLSFRVIAVRLCISHQWVRAIYDNVKRIVRVYGIFSDEPPAVVNDVTNTVYKLRQQGIPDWKVALILGISGVKVRELYRRAVKMRHSGIFPS